MQHFLASVASCDAFRTVGGKLTHYFSAKTLTDSGLNISVSAEEVRGGLGAKLLGQFFHSSKMDINLTDTMFKLEYIAAQVGSEIDNGGIGTASESFTVTEQGKLSITGTPVELLDGTGFVIWYKPAGGNDYASVVLPSDTTDFTSFDAPGVPVGQQFCISYYKDSETARNILVSADFVPYELFLIMTAQLYAGDASAPETGKPVGTVTIKVPRFQLNGTMDISMAMSSAATMPLAGTALAYDAGCEDGNYAEIIEDITGVYNGYTSIVADDVASLEVGDYVSIFAVGTTKIPLALTPSEVTFGDLTVVSAEGEVLKVGETTITLNADEAVTGSITISSQDA